MRYSVPGESGPPPQSEPQLPPGGDSGTAPFTTRHAGAQWQRGESRADALFSIAKLVPGLGGTSQWVSYIVNSTPTKTAASAILLAVEREIVLKHIH